MVDQQLSSKAYIPEDAYLYFPKPQEIKTHGKRSFFGGLASTNFDPYEGEMIQEFKSYAKKQHYTLKPTIWTDNYILRFLVANEFKLEKTLQDVKEHTYWRELKCPIQLTPKIESFLNSGLLYAHGRDHKFRPIVIFNVNLIDRKTFDMDLVTDALTFWLKYIIDEWMLPFQVEHWVFICNIKGMGMASIAVSSVRKLFQYLQCNFKCRLFKTYLINASAAIYAPWRIVQKFLDGDTKDKVEFFRKQIPKSLFDHTNPEQVEEQFGGTAPNCTQYWPPKIPSNNYFVSPNDAKNLISKEEYKSLYQKGQLRDMKVNESLIQEKHSEVSQSISPFGKESMKSSQEFDNRNASLSTLSSLKTDYDQIPDGNDLPESYSKSLKGLRELRGPSIYEEDYIDDMSESYAPIQKKEKVREFEAYFF